MLRTPIPPPSLRYSNVMRAKISRIHIRMGLPTWKWRERGARWRCEWKGEDEDYNQLEVRLEIESK